MDELKIGEKVKFWQEQDRINRELIPRVIKNHELLAKHVESHEDGDSLAPVTDRGTRNAYGRG